MAEVFRLVWDAIRALSERCNNIVNMINSLKMQTAKDRDEIIKLRQEVEKLKATVEAMPKKRKRKNKP